ncbi:MAG: hypothetical protein QG635_1133, partial [Bacteroidota bacterium]|nr:hypothetical protein [Bacteroidota bacterium]
DYELAVKVENNLINYYKNKGDLNNALRYSKELNDLKDTINTNSLIREADKLEGKFRLDMKSLEQKRREEEQERIKTLIIIVAAVGLISLIIFLIIVIRQRGKSEKLLRNILPDKIAKRLKKKEKYIADRFDDASVVFIDIVNFTKLSNINDIKNSGYTGDGISPEQIVEMLNFIYTKLDKIAEKFGLEKIKTIGDCYMAVAGLPVPRNDHAEAAAGFAIEAMKTIDGIKYKFGNFPVKIRFRCGIDCGIVIAGVIGEKKFIYDLWGDTVNTASRMEEYGLEGMIQVTERFAEKIEDCYKNNNEVKLYARGELDIKGKGMMKAYLLELLNKNI